MSNSLDIIKEYVAALEAYRTRFAWCYADADAEAIRERYRVAELALFAAAGRVPTNTYAPYSGTPR